MPQVSRFFGIVIYMYFNDHAPPHFHAEYGSNEAMYAIETLEKLRGGLPRRAHSLVVAWEFCHRTRLLSTRNNARLMQRFDKIDTWVE